MTAVMFHFVWWNVHCDTCDSPSETENTHTGTFVCRGTLTDGMCGFLRGVRRKCGSQESFFNNK